LNIFLKFPKKKDDDDKMTKKKKKMVVPRGNGNVSGFSNFFRVKKKSGVMQIFLYIAVARREQNIYFDLCLFLFGQQWRMNLLMER